MLIPFIASLSGSGGGIPSIANAYTTADGKQPFLIIGDSIANGTSIAGKGPTPVSGTVYEYNNSGQVVEVGANDLETANTGSQYPQMGTTYYNATGKKMVFVETALGGTEFSPNGDANNWSTSGNMFAPAVAKANAALNYLGLTRLRGIIIHLGINDARGSQPLSTIYADMESLFARISFNFPYTPVYISMIGRSETAISNTRIDGIRGKQLEIIANNPLYHESDDLRVTALNHPEYYSADQLHLNQTGCNAKGVKEANYIIANP